ncbi:conserved hypothetical protein [Flavobacterium sp. 9AF]|uniref:hypothetical protein n=1 Tax=Flavobacterium sp. 9AF TaxID=2653142 RepID=UPI0012F052E1|nr:hypothetical protein [Flavobacterium sp. 9AF]VXA95154.1 conserved hypothetical protein [Flavobacterium sp. 9AF]
MKKLIWLIGLLAFLSCETESDKFIYSKFKITDANGQSIIRVDDKGNVYKQGNRVGNIEKKGVILDKKGRIVLKLSDNKTSFLDSEDKKVIEISSTGEFINTTNDKIHWSDSGELMKGDENTGIAISATEKELLQIASVLLYIFYIV